MTNATEPSALATEALHPVVEQLLAGRGLTSPGARRRFLSPDYGRDLADPFELADMKPAIDRIEAAIKGGELITIYGDYDIDGLTATAVLVKALRQAGAKVQPYIPDRFEEGYGLNQAALEALQHSGTSLVVTVDCGVTAAAEAAWAKDHGLDLIITDHHAVPEQLPEALAVINPKRPDDSYPFKELAGVGVAYKLVQALQKRLGRPQSGQEKWLLDLVALGTICDVVSLLGENRALAYFGLKVLNQTRRPGLKALATVCGLEPANLGSYHVGWMLGPRLNAAGRLEHASISLQLLMTTSGSQALALAAELNDLNRSRQSDQAIIFDQANRQAAEYEGDPVLVLADSNWSHGIVGIVASKLMERWCKPALVLQIMGADAKGSGRSLAEFNLVEGLRQISPLFSRFGGHHFAAGFSLKTSKIGQLRREINRVYRQTAQPRPPAVKPEIELTNLAEVNWELQRQLIALEPHGHGNPKPLFGWPQLKLQQLRPVGKDQTHLKLELADNSGQSLGAIAFGLAGSHPDLRTGQTVGIEGQIDQNDFLGQISLQLVVSKINEQI